MIEAYNQLNKDFIVYIRPRRMQMYFDFTKSTSEKVEQYFNGKKKKNSIYIYYFLKERFPFLQREDIANCLNCTRQNIINIEKQINKLSGKCIDFEEHIDNLKDIIK